MMRRALLVVLLLCTATFGASKISGTFSGDWIGTGASGDFRIKVEESGGKPQLEVTFTLGGTEVKTQIVRAALNDDKIEAAYEFMLGDNKLQSAIVGRLNGSRLEGTYKTTAVAQGAQVDEGTWKATRKE
jgi:hypothetical protein